MELFMVFLGVAVGLLFGFSAVAVYNGLPAGWLCDYGEVPSDRHLGERIKRQPASVLFSVGFGISVLLLNDQFMGQPVYVLFGLLLLWFLLQIYLADRDFLIIPDQWILAVALCGLLSVGMDFYKLYQGRGLPYFHDTYWSPLAGAVLCGGSLLVIGLAGSFLMKKEAMGFGDVKLLFAIGFSYGFLGAVVVLLLSVLLCGGSLLLLLLAKKIKKEDQAPFGPYIALAAGGYLLFYRQIGQIVYGYLGSF